MKSLTYIIRERYFISLLKIVATISKLEGIECKLLSQDETEAIIEISYPDHLSDSLLFAVGAFVGNMETEAILIQN